MQIIVCIKQVLNPEIPPRDFKLDYEKKEAIRPANSPLVISPFDENAMEAAVQLKERHGGKVTVLSAGGKEAVEALKKALSMGADEAFLLDDAAFHGSDVYGSAYILSRAIKKLGNFDLVLVGRTSSDWGYGQVGAGIAYYLDIPLVTLAQKIEIQGNLARVERVREDGHEVVRVAMPALVTVSNEINEPRLPNVKGILRASRMAVPVWTAKDIDAEPSLFGPASARLTVEQIKIPAYESKCEFVREESPERAAEEILHKLRALKII